MALGQQRGPSTERRKVVRKLSYCMVFVLVLITTAWGAVDALAQPIECSSKADQVTAVTNPAGHVINTNFQSGNPNLQQLLSTTIKSAGRGCVIAHLSGLARITDNYVVFQVRVDGVVMHGHQLTGLANPDTPVVIVSIDATNGTSPSGDPLDDEQFIDPTKVAAFNFFAEVDTGMHTVEVFAAAGSGIDPLNQPRVSSLVLTLEYR